MRRPTGQQEAPGRDFLIVQGASACGHKQADRGGFPPITNAKFSPVGTSASFDIRKLWSIITNSEGPQVHGLDADRDKNAPSLC